jgi:hypothetical protein
MIKEPGFIRPGTNGCSGKNGNCRLHRKFIGEVFLEMSGFSI